MRALVLGTGGVLGEAVARQLAAKGVHVFCASRRQVVPKKGIQNVIQLRADRSQPHAIAEALKAQSIDILVDIIAYTMDETAPLLAQVDGKISRYVMISSSDVYRNYGLLHRKESGPVEQGLIDEEGQLRQSRYPYKLESARDPDDPLWWMDSYDKIPLEAKVRSMKTAWTILRLPMVFGPGDRQRRFRWAVGPMLKDASFIEIPPAWAKWITTYGYVENVAAAIATSAVHPVAERSVFNVTDFDPVPHIVWLKRFQKSIGWQGKIVQTENPQNRIARGTSEIDLSVPIRLKGERLRKDLAFKPPVSLAAAIALTIEDERRQN